MAGSVGFLSMEVKLDLDNAERGIKDLARMAKSELGKPIKIDDASFKGMASTLAALEGSYADTLQIVERMNASTANLARSTKAVAEAARYAVGEQQKSARVAAEQEKTERERLRLAQEQAKAEGAIGAAQAKAKATLDYGAQQQEMIAAKQAVVVQERLHKAVLDEVGQAQKDANAAMRDHQKLIADVSKMVDEATEDVTKEQERALSVMKDQTDEIEKQSALRAGLRTATAGVDWGVTAVGAAQARNYGYATGAIIQAGKAMLASLRAVPAAAAVATAGVAAIAIAAAGAAAAIGKITLATVKLGASGAVELEQMVVQMNALLPTAEMASQEIEGLFQLGTRTIAPTTALIELDKRLLLAGGQAAQMRQSIVEGYAAFTTAVGATTEQMNSLNYLIGEVTLKGRLMRTEMSQQFATSGLGQAEFLQATAEATGKSVAELNKALEEGTFSAEMFLEGLNAYFAKFAKGADAALLVVKALAQNIKERITSSISKAFLDAGVTTGLSKILLSVQALVERIVPYFAVIGQKVSEFLRVVARGFKSFAEGEGAGALEFVFGKLIPSVIDLATRWVAAGIGFIRANFIAFGLIVKSLIAPIVTFSQTMGGMGQSMSWVSVVMAGMMAPIGTLAASIRILIGAAYSAAYAILAIKRALFGDFAGAADAAYAAVGSMALGFSDAAKMAGAFAGAIKQAGKASKGFKGPDLPSTGRNPLASGGGAASPSDSGGSSGADKAAKDISSALAELYDATRRWLGQRSELEQSLTGGLRGFTASADSIVEQGIRIRQTLDKAGYSAKSGLVKFLSREIKELARLARDRDALTKRLEEQQAALDDLVGARSQMVSGVQQGISAFVTALQTEQETVSEYMRLDAVGSFIITEKKKSKSWVAAMKERLAATKTFIANIRKLQARGLNPETIRQLVEAGPEAAADAVAELTAGGDETINEVNAIQSELAGLSSEFAEEQAGNYYDAGIAQAEALIEGTRAKIGEIEKAADEIAKAIRKRLDAIAEPAREAGEAAGGAFGGGVGTGFTAGVPAADGLLEAWDLGGGIEELSTSVTENATEMGRSIIDGLVAGVKEKLSGIWDTIKQFFWQWFISPFLKWLLISSPSGLFKGYGQDIVQGLVDGIREWLSEKTSKITSFFSNAFDGAKHWLTVTLPDWFERNMPGVWGWIKTGFFNTRTWLSEKFDGFKDWLTVSLPNWFSRNMGSVWSNIKSGFPSMLSWIKDKFAAAMDWLGGKGRYAGGGLPGAVRSGINSIIRLWNNLRFRAPSATIDLPGLPAWTIGGWWADTPNIPYLASGGMVTAPTMAMVGERGDEAVLPLTNPAAMRSIADAITAGMAQNGAIAPEVRVYIGNREITDIVKVEVAERDRDRNIRAYAGRGS